MRRIVKILNDIFEVSKKGQETVILDIVEEEEIRDTDEHYFSISDVLNNEGYDLSELKEWEVYLTDTHSKSDDSDLLDMNFCIGGFNGRRTILAKSGQAYRTEPSIRNQAGYRQLLLVRESMVRRDGSEVFANISYSEMVKRAKFEFYEWDNLVDDEVNREEYIKQSKEKTLFEDGQRFYVKFRESPEEGSLYLKFKGVL